MADIDPNTGVISSPKDDGAKNKRTRDSMYTNPIFTERPGTEGFRNGIEKMVPGRKIDGATCFNSSKPIEK